VHSTDILEDIEVCPSCGELVRQLDSTTGWCLDCSGTTKVSCLSCGGWFQKDQPHRKLCQKCRDERWLARNANSLETLLLHGYAIDSARIQIYERNRPRCLSCGAVLTGARNGALFCTKTKECRSWRRRYRTLMERYRNRGSTNPAKQASSQVNAEIWLMNND
jgi:hypothetical protein